MTSTTTGRPVPTAYVPMLGASIAQDRQRADRAQQMHAEATARALPDDLFADDPEIQRLTRDYEVVDARVNRLARVNRADVQAAIKRLEQEVGQVQEQLRGAAVDDALDGDFEFPRSAAVFRRGDALRQQLEAARLGFEVFAKPAPERNQFDDELHRTKDALAVALLERKRAYMAEHPELLECDLDVVRQHKRLPPVSASGQDADTRSASAPAGAVDWARIELDYRAGVKSLREIAEGSGVSHVAISKHATKAGWTRDLSQKVQAEAGESAVNSGVNTETESAVRTEVRTETSVSERQVVEANAQAVAEGGEDLSEVLPGEDAP